MQTIAFSADNKRLLSTDGRGRVVLWDTATGRQARILNPTGSFHRPEAATFTHDGQRILMCGSSGGRKEEVSVWNAKTGAAQKGFAVEIDIQFRPAFSADGTLLATCGRDAVVRVWDTAAGKELLRFPRHPYPVLGAAFSADGRYLATGGHRNDIHLWELATGGLVCTLPSDGDNLFAFSPDGRVLASAGWGDIIHLWDVGTGKERRALRPRNRLNALSFRHDGKALAAAGVNGVIHVWDLADGKQKLPGADLPDSMLPLAFVSGGKQLAVGSSTHLTFWEIAAPARPDRPWTVRSLRRLDTGGRPLALSADGKLAFVDQSQSSCLWDVEAAAELRKFRENHLSATAFAADAKTLATAQRGRMLLWNVSKGSLLRVVPGSGLHESGFAFSPDGKVLATAGSERDHTLRFCNATSGEIEREVAIPMPENARPGRVMAMRSLAFAPDGKVLAVADAYSDIKLWDMGKSRFDGTLPAGLTLAFAPDGKVLAVAGHDNSIRLYDVATRQSVRELRGHEGTIKVLLFSPDGRLLASGGSDQTILLWDIRSSK